MVLRTLSQEMEDNTVYTVEKKQAQENLNRFNSIWVSLSYFKVFFFFLLIGRKKMEKVVFTLWPVSSFFTFSSRICPAKKGMQPWHRLFPKLTESFMLLLHSPPICLFSLFLISSRCKCDCVFPINSSCQRVSSRSQPHFLQYTKITRGGGGTVGEQH